MLEGGAGLIVPDKNPAALAEAIERYVGDPALAAKTGCKGRHRVLEAFDVVAVVSQLLDRISLSHAARKNGASPRSADA